MKQSPSYLESSGRAFWLAAQREYEITDQHDLTRLEHAAHALDRIDQARAEIETEGMFFVDRFGQPKAHPGEKVERDNKLLFCRLVRELGLGQFVTSDGPRIPRQY